MERRPTFDRTDTPMARAQRHLAPWLGALWFGAICSPASWAQAPGVTSETAQLSNVLQNVSTAQVGGTTVVRLEFKNDLPALPPGFVMQNPPRIALDLPARLGDGVNAQTQVDQGEIRTMALVSTPKVTRMVLALKRPGRYTATTERNALVIAVEPLREAATAAFHRAAEPFEAPSETDVAVTATAAAAPSAGALESQTLASTAALAGASDALARPANSASVASATPVRPKTTAERSPSNSATVRDLEFRRGPNGESRIVIDLSSAQLGVDVKQQGTQLVIEVPKARISENLRRRFDVADFGTPIRQFQVTQAGDNVRIETTPQGLWTHSAYQTDQQFVLEVRPAQDDPNRLKQAGRGYKGDKLSMNFQNIDVRALLQVIADFTDINIIASETVTGTLTLRLKDVPWDQALDIIMQSRGLDMRRQNNVMWIAPREELAAKEKIELENRQQLAELEPLKSESFQLNYQKAEALGKLLTDDKQRVLSKRGSAVVDQRTNQIFIQDTAARLEEVRKLVSKVDVAVRQVLIEARIVEANDQFSRNLGARLGFNDQQSSIYNTIAVTDPVSGAKTALNVPVYGTGGGALGAYGTISGNMAGVQDLSGQNGSGLSGLNANGLGRATAAANTQFVNLPAGAINGNQPASMAISIFGNKLTRFVNLEISALEADQRGKVISSPRVLTADQGKAVIEQGTELPYQQSTASGATAVSFKKANLRLEVMPQITPEGNVILDVEVNRDAVGRITPTGFAIDTRRVKTTVLIENGGTIVIGGIYEQTDRNQTAKVPLLGDLPLVGNLFKSTQKTNDRSELLVFLTPRVVNDSATTR